MKLAVDVDAAAKLAHWGMLPHLPELLGIDLTECFTLTSLKFRAKKAIEKPDGKVFHSTEAAQAAVDFCAILAAAPEVTLMPQLQDLQGIDAGEAVLLSAMHLDPQIRMLTGDKRAMRALSAAPPEVREVFVGRVFMLEQLLAIALDRFGLDWLREKVCPYRHIDKAALIVMGSRCDAAEPSVRDAISAYVAEVHRLCNPSLLCTT